MNVELIVPDPTTLTRRNQSLITKLKKVGKPSTNIMGKELIESSIALA